MNFKLFIGVLCIISIFNSNVCAQDLLYRNEDVPMHDRIVNLLSILTVEEKISLLRATSPGIPRLNIEKYYHGNEALHGVVRPGNFTVFPQAIGLASMWNPKLHYEIATVISDEARARWNELCLGKEQLGQFSDLLTFWSPTVNMARDPRWGRTPETYGEDPYLSGVLGKQFVKGLQGNHPRYLKVVSTPKHFAANNEEHNRFECNPQISEKQLREYYLPAFESCVVDGNSESIMTAYNAINDVPCTLNTWLIQKVLRGDWNFDGYVVSDCGGPGLLVNGHHYVKTKEAAATLSIKAGLDLECGDDVYIEPLLNAYKLGMVSDADIDSAAYHVLRARMRLGLFDDPNHNPYNKISPSIIGSESHKALALEAARQSIVLLKNENNILPINLKKLKSIAVVGINAGSCEFGDYSGTPVGEPISILQGIKDRVGDKVKVNYAPWVSSQDGYELIDKSYFPNGLTAKYFTSNDLKGTYKERIDDWVNFEPANQAPDPFLPKSPISIQWQGDLCPNISGKYTIGFKTDDGCRLYIDDKLLIDSWRTRSAETDQVELELKAGQKYKIVAEYFDSGGEALAKLYWKIPDKENKDILTYYGNAEQVVKSSDLTIAVLGINKSIEREGQDRKDISLPKDQEDFIKAVYKLNPNTIVVLVAGSSLAINWIDENIHGIINAWYPGEQGGRAVAEVLFGDYNPAGRLPLTYYKSIGDLPPFDDYDITKGRTYQYFKKDVLYPFGYGLSYTQFNYTNLVMNEDIQGGVIDFSFDLENIGNYDGEEVAQLYIKFPDSVKEKPIKQLKGFDRVFLKRNQKKTIHLTLNLKDVRLWDVDAAKFITPKGKYEIFIGPSSDKVELKAGFEL